MKTIKKMILCSMAGVLLAGCGNDWLDVNSSTAVDSETALNSLSDFEYTVTGIYSTMQSENSYGARMQYYGDVTGDDIQGTKGTARGADFYLFSYNKDNAPSTFWRSGFDIMASSNQVLTKIDKVKVDEEDEDEIAYRDDIKGQALTLRALALFDLTRVYGYPYLKDNGASWGGVVIKEVVNKDYQPRRSTVAQCYVAIIEDLEEAIPLLSEDRTKGKINKWAAMTLLSRVYLYKGDNENALRVAKAGIVGAKEAGFKLWTNAEYADAWKGEFTSEVFFEIVQLLTDGPSKESIGNLWYQSGYYTMSLTSSFEAFMKAEDKNDVRYKMVKYVTSSTEGKTRYVCNKYPGQTGEKPTEANVPVFRMSELYLNAAEAAVKMGAAGQADAVTYLDEIVKRANPAKTVVGTTITLEKVLNERRKEFYGEGHRMFDAMRNNQRIVRQDIPDGKVKHLSLSDYARSFDWNMFKVVLPVPKAEMDANPNMRDQQNPGY